MTQVTAHIPVGTSATQSELVTPELTVAHFLAELPEVYGTPMMIFLMEQAGESFPVCVRFKVTSALSCTIWQQ